MDSVVGEEGAVEGIRDNVSEQTSLAVTHGTKELALCGNLIEDVVEVPGVVGLTAGGQEECLLR